jgi:tRNA A-37 threonylcarbamoyl transferase component Bud32
VKERWTETVDGPIPLFNDEPFLRPSMVFDGRYEILRFIGQGGYAFVYAANDRLINNTIALKVLRPDRLTALSVKRLRREVAIARKASDPHLVRVFDIGECAEGTYLTMEFVDAPTLRQTIENRDLAIEDVLRYARETIAAIESLHALGIVHRDIKPSNILVSKDSVKLADFGLAFDADSDESRLTQTAALVGTPEYLSPEQALGQPVDARSDLYSFGVVLFEMLTGTLPFGATSSLGAVVAHLQERAPDVRSLRRDVPRWLARTVGILLEKDPARRFQSASSVASVLRDQHLPLHRVIRWGKVSVMGIVAAILIAAVTVTFYLRSFERIQSDGKQTITALDHRGRALWSLDGVRPDCCVAVVHKNGRSAFIAAIRDSGAVSDSTSPYELLLLDVQTGVLRRKALLASGRSAFSRASNDFHVAALGTADIEGTGNDIVVISHTHGLYWPSYTSVYNPETQISGIVFYASGHHRYVGAADVDGDGRKDLLLFGINNRMGWASALAAVAVRTTQLGSTSLRYVMGSTPDMESQADGGRSLLWYALLHPGHSRGISAVDARRRLITAEYEDRAVETVGFDGFAVRQNIDSGARNQKRMLAYEELRDANRLFSGGFMAEARAAADRAAMSATSASDAPLLEWVSRQRAAFVILAGAFDQGNQAFEDLVKASRFPSEIAFDAAHACHLAGHLERATDWYRRGLGTGSENDLGRGKYEFVEGETLALGELGKWDEAIQAIRTFEHQYPSQSAMAESLEQYVRWRNGEPRLSPITAGERDPDEMRYWRLEIMRANGAAGTLLLNEIESEKLRSSGDTLLLSLQAEVLSDLGRVAEAYSVARKSYGAARDERKTDTIIRAHYDLIASRFAARARAFGRNAEAADATTDLPQSRR